MHLPAPAILVLIVATIPSSVLLSALVIDADPPPSELPQGVELVYTSFVTPAYGLARGDAECPAGKVLTGGGSYSNAVSSTLLVLDSLPVQTGKSYVWRARFSNKSAKEVTVGAVAICAAVATSVDPPSTVTTERTTKARPQTPTATTRRPTATTRTPTATTTTGGR